MLVETKTVPQAALSADFIDTITFENNPEDYTLKVFIWNGMGENGMEPLFDTAAAMRPGKNRAKVQ